MTGSTSTPPILTRLPLPRARVWMVDHSPPSKTAQATTINLSHLRSLITGVELPAEAVLNGAKEGNIELWRECDSRTAMDLADRGVWEMTIIVRGGRAFSLCVVVLDEVHAELALPQRSIPFDILVPLRRLSMIPATRYPHRTGHTRVTRASIAHHLIARHLHSITHNPLSCHIRPSNSTHMQQSLKLPAF